MNKNRSKRLLRQAERRKQKKEGHPVNPRLMIEPIPIVEWEWEDYYNYIGATWTSWNVSHSLKKKYASINVKVEIFED